MSRRSRCDSSASTSVMLRTRGCRRLLAREGQQLAHQVGGAVGVLLDLHDVGEGRIARPEAQQQQIAEADHRGQQIVEVVRDAAGELAHRLHLLRLRELRFEALLLGGVDEMQHQAAAVGVGVAARFGCRGLGLRRFPRTGRRCRLPVVHLFFIVEPVQQQNQDPSRGCSRPDP